MGLSRIHLYLSEKESLGPAEASVYQALIERRGSHIPLEYVMGKVLFLDEEFLVDSRVLIPRPETELLVEEAIRRLTKIPEPFVIDIGTGCGNIAAILAKRLKARTWAIDISREALAVAESNAKRLGVCDRITFLEGDLFGPLKGLDLEGRVDLVISNPPYVKRSDIARLAPEIRLHEPTVALDGGEDGLTFYRKLIPDSGLFLKPGSFLFLEVGDGLGKDVKALVEAQNSFFKKPEILEDLSGMERILIAKKANPQQILS